MIPVTEEEWAVWHAEAAYDMSWRLLSKASEPDVSWARWEALRAHASGDHDRLVVAEERLQAALGIAVESRAARNFGLGLEVPEEVLAWRWQPDWSGMPRCGRTAGCALCEGHPMKCRTDTELAVDPEEARRAVAEANALAAATLTRGWEPRTPKELQS